MKFPLSHSRPLRAVLALLLLALAACAGPGLSRFESGARADAQVYDVIVVGAGLSGLTTAKDLIRARRSVLVLEATGRIGGRALTDGSFPVPIDLGAAWLHGADANPLTAVADWLNFHRAPSNLDGPVFIGNGRLAASEAKAFRAAYEKTEEAMAQARAEGRDQAVSDFLPEDQEYRALIAANIGPLESGAEAGKTSSADAAAFQADPDDFLSEGIGTFVARFGRDVPVQLNTPVTAIRYGDELGGEVLVEAGPGRSYRGRRVVITVSTGVLAARRIAFHPELPEWKWKAIHGLPMGLLNKIIFQFTGNAFPGEGDSEWVLYQRPGPPDGHDSGVMAFVIKPLGANLAVGFYGADQARRFEALGDQAAIDHAKAALADMYGPGVVARIRDSATKVTRWGQNPWTLGSYSAALPGASKMHAELAKPVADRVFFAGEAAGPPEFNGSLAAAYVAGLQASRGVQESLAGKK